MPWPDLRTTRRDLMAPAGIVLENAADMADCFPELWASTDAARQDRSRSVTYLPFGAGHRARTARVDLVRIPDPDAWLTNRLGPLAHCDIAVPPGDQETQREQLNALASRLTDSMQAAITTRQVALDALFARLEAAAPGRSPASSAIKCPQKRENPS